MTPTETKIQMETATVYVVGGTAFGLRAGTEKIGDTYLDRNVNITDAAAEVVARLQSTETADSVAAKIQRLRNRYRQELNAVSFERQKNGGVKVAPVLRFRSWDQTGL